MKKILQNLLLAIILIIAMHNISKATAYTIEVNDSAFVQNFDSVVVGDVITWVWVSGNHTTTSNGIPTGALPWSQAIDQFHTSYTYEIKFGGTYNYISVPDAPLMGESFEANYPVGISSPVTSVFNFNVIGLPSKNKIEYAFTISQSAAIDLSLYNLVGNKVATFYSGNIAAGNYHFEKLLPANLASGIYFLSLKFGEGNITRRVVIP